MNLLYSNIIHDKLIKRYENSDDKKKLQEKHQKNLKPKKQKKVKLSTHANGDCKLVS